MKIADAIPLRIARLDSLSASSYERERVEENPAAAVARGFSPRSEAHGSFVQTRAESSRYRSTPPP